MTGRTRENRSTQRLFEAGLIGEGAGRSTEESGSGSVGHGAGTVAQAGGDEGNLKIVHLSCVVGLDGSAGLVAVRVSAAAAVVTQQENTAFFLRSVENFRGNEGHGVFASQRNCFPGSARLRFRCPHVGFGC